MKRKWMSALKSVSLVVVLLSLLLSSWPSEVLAEGPPTPESNESAESQMRNCMDPNYVYTEEELRAIAAKNKLVEQYAKERIGPRYIGRKILPVGIWKEPNDYAHRNYCGPGATQVALDARLPASQVPNIDTLGEELNIDPNAGVWLCHNTETDIRDVLNDHLNTNWYWCDGSGSETTLYYRIVRNIDHDYAMVTGCVTNEMPGWQRDVNHIVTVYGYYEPSGAAQYVYYTETAGSVAGYDGSYRQTALRQDFWEYVSPNDAQAW